MNYLLKSKETFPPSADFIAPYAAFLELAGADDYGRLVDVLEALSGGDDTLIAPSLYSTLGAPGTVLRRRRVSRFIGEVLESGYAELVPGDFEIEIAGSPNSLNRVFEILTDTLGFDTGEASEIIGKSLSVGATLI